jgi:hypothetical protein
MNIASLKVSIGADLTGLEKGMAQASRSLQSFGKNMTATGMLLSKALTAPIAAFGAVSVNAFTKQEDAERKLAAAIATTGGEVDKNMARFKAFASELQSVTRVGDETTLQLLQVATAQGLTADSAERAARNAIAMESAFGVSASSAIRMTAALEGGDATMLKRYIPALKGVEDNTLAVAMAQDILNGAFDIAKADAQTFGGQLVQLKNSFGDFQEQVGSVIAEAMTPFIRRAKELVDSLLAMDREVLKTYVTIGLLVAAIGPAVTIMGKLAMAISAVMAPIYLKIAVIGLLIAAFAELALTLDRAIDDMVFKFKLFAFTVLEGSKRILLAIADISAVFGSTLPIAVIAGVATIQSAMDSIDFSKPERESRGLVERIGDGFDTFIQKIKDSIFSAESEIAKLPESMRKTAQGVSDAFVRMEPPRVPVEVEFVMADVVKRAEQALQPLEDLLSFDYNIPDKMFPPGSLGYLNTELSYFRGQLQWATDPEVITSLLNKIEELETQIASTTDRTYQMSASVQFLSGIADTFTASFGQGMANVVVQGEKLTDVLRNIGRLLLSSAIQKGLSVLLTGGLSAAGTGFFGSGGGLFGKLFGKATSVNDALIQSNGNIVKFHPDDNILAMKDFGNLSSSIGRTQSGNMSVDVRVADIVLRGSDIVLAFENSKRYVG